MKRNKSSRYATAVAIASLAGVLSACGGSSNSSTAAAGAGVAVPGVTGTPSETGGCVALTTNMSFSATNAYIDSANIYAVPSGVTGATPVATGTAGAMQTYVSVGGAVTAAVGNGIYSNSWNTSVSDAYVSMTINNYNTTTATTIPNGYTGYPIPTISGPGSYGSYGAGYPYSAIGSQAYESLTGALQFTSQRWQVLMYEFQSQSQYGYGSGAYPGAYPGGGTGTIPTVGAATTTIPNVCVSGVAISMGHYNNLLYGGDILLFLNNNPSTYIDLKF